MTLSIRPVRLKKSIYFRVPNDIVDLIGLEDDSQVALTLEERTDRHLLIYSVYKGTPAGGIGQEAYSTQPSPPQPINRSSADSSR